MRRRPGLTAAGAGLALAVTGWAEPWPGWRGPRGDGTSRETAVPVHWTATSNVLWKVPVPGVGHASPIVWDHHVFTVTCLPDTGDRVLLAFDRDSGRTLWQRTVVQTPLERKHPLNSHASSTPATDGESVYAAFLDGERMLVAAYDFAGHQHWLVRPGEFHSMHGFCSSPVLFEDKVIVNGDHDGDGYIVALARSDGRELWRIDRPNKTRSYCAPTIFEIAGRTQMVLSGTECVTSYDPHDGRLHWIIDGPTEQFVASIVYHASAGLFFVTGGYPAHHLLAVRPDGNGNITDTHIAWRHRKASYVAYVPSPIAAGDYFLVVSDLGDGCCFAAKSGELMWQEDFGEEHASLVSANGLVYFLNDAGVTRVVRPGPRLEVVAVNELGERCYASPAISDGRIYLRSFQHLYAIGTTP
ncbi:MAG: PQQ-binding-like beta-propeller repeat protein [Verrucomicrobiales bacterium]|nr:PQQ-binding-like beta-propeller repeat protein [Verrucomicrobiales bacterium]